MFKTILSNFHLEKILWIIKSKLKYMILAGLVCAMLGSAFAYFNQSSLYQARISFYVYSNPEYVTDTGVNLSTNEISSAKSLLDSYMQILKSTTFLNKVIDALDLEQYGYTATYLKSHIGASAVSNTTVFYVNVLDENPILAMEIANTIGELAPSEIIRIVKSGGIQVLDEAVLPTTPYSATSVFKYALLGGAAGFIIVAFIAMLKGLLDTTVRRKYEIEDMFTIPIIGTVPLVISQKNQKPDVILREESPFVIKEAYNDIRANLLYTARGQKCPVYAITSADMNEGKSLNSLNIAISYAQIGKKVLLIDADMRRSKFKKILGIDNVKTGLSEYLAGINQKLDIIKQQDNLDIVTSGGFPPNPSELLTSSRWEEFINKYKESYDVIFVDLPPLGIVSDALALVDIATAYILVVREKVTKFEREKMIVQKLEPLNANICGFVYNGISMKSPDYNYRHYGYGKGYEN